VKAANQPSGPYPGTLCVAPASASQCLSSNSVAKASIEVDAIAPGVANNVQLTAEPAQSVQGSVTAPVVAPLNIKAMNAPYALPADSSALWTPTSAATVPARALTPKSAAITQFAQNNEQGSFTGQNWVTSNLMRPDGVPTPLRAHMGTSLLGPGPARSPSYVGPARTPPSRSPEPRSPDRRGASSAVPGSPCVSRSGSPLPQREVLGSARTNVYGLSGRASAPTVLASMTPPRNDVTPVRDGRPPRSISPLPGQHQATAPTLQMQSSGAGASWQFQGRTATEGTFVAPSRSASAVRYSRVSSPLPRPMSPQPSHQLAESTNVLPTVSLTIPFTSDNAVPFSNGALISSARTNGLSQRSTTPGGSQQPSFTPGRGDSGCYSPQPQPRASYAYAGYGINEFQSQQRSNLPLKSSSGDAMGGSTGSAAAGNSFILTASRPHTQSLSSSGRATDRSLQVREISPQPSRPLSPMPGSPMAGNHQQCGFFRPPGALHA